MFQGARQNTDTNTSHATAEQRQSPLGYNGLGHRTHTGNATGSFTSQGTAVQRPPGQNRQGHEAHTGRVTGSANSHSAAVQRQSPLGQNRQGHEAHTGRVTGSANSHSTAIQRQSPLGQNRLGHAASTGNIPGSLSLNDQSESRTYFSRHYARSFSPRASPTAFHRTGDFTSASRSVDSGSSAPSRRMAICDETDFSCHQRRKMRVYQKRF